jgi:protein-disulfide isomerase
LDLMKFRTCLNRPETEALLQQLIQVGVDQGLSSTPTFFFNGRRLDGIPTMFLIRRALEELRK